MRSIWIDLPLLKFEGFSTPAGLFDFAASHREHDPLAYRNVQTQDYDHRDSERASLVRLKHRVSREKEKVNHQKYSDLTGHLCLVSLTPDEGRGAQQGDYHEIANG